MKKRTAMWHRTRIAQMTRIHTDPCKSVQSVFIRVPHGCVFSLLPMNFQFIAEFAVSMFSHFSQQAAGH
ncbi:MAG TPA: hypothetical protein VIO11_07975 [Candidatus Methanoperedens sp.]